MSKVFVYGSLKQGYGNNRLLSLAKFLGATETVDDTYDLRCWGSFPAVYKQGDTSIKGELYEVDEDTMKNLDYLEGYPSFYNRERVQLYSGDMAWMYYIDAHHSPEGKEGTLCPEGIWPARKDHKH